MDLTMGIAAMSMNMSSAAFSVEMGTSLLRETLDVAEIQGDATSQMLNQVPPSDGHLLDIYA